jgi:ketosteroid isomerase-like protein
MALFVRLWDAYGQGRLDDALHLIDPAFELRAAGTERVYRGHDGVVAVMAEFRRRWKSVTLTSEEVVEVDDVTIVAIGRLTAFDHSGARVRDGSLAWVTEFAGGKLLRATSYSTRAEALRAAAEHPRGAD